MSSEVETSRDLTFRQLNGIPPLRFASLGMTTPLFTALHIYHDNAPHSSAMNMAIDEALLEHAAVPSIRFYQWHSPALSFGYFGKFADVADYSMSAISFAVGRAVASFFMETISLIRL